MSKAFSFAHLIGLAALGGRAAKATEDDDKEKGRKAEGPLDDDPSDQQNARGKRAENDDEDPDAEDDDLAEDDDEDTPKGRKARKAKGKGNRAEDDDETDPDAEEGDDDNDESAKAVRADRKRCAHIMAYGIKNNCAKEAFVLAFDSNVSRSAAVNLLSVTGRKATGTNLDQRMQALNVAQVGVGASTDLPAGVSAVAAGIIAAGNKK